METAATVVLTLGEVTTVNVPRDSNYRMINRHASVGQLNSIPFQNHFEFIHYKIIWVIASEGAGSTTALSKEVSLALHVKNTCTIVYQ